MKFDLGYINKVVAVIVNLDGDKTCFHYLILKKSKGEIEVLGSGKNVEDVKDLAKKISTKNPVLLHFAGKGILNRSVKKEENYRHSILLNANVEDFYFTDYIEDKTVFSSVIRKSQVDDHIEEFTNHKLQIISISSGPFIAAPLIHFITKSELISGETLLKFESKKLIEYQKTEERGSVLIGDERIDHDLIAAVGIGAQFFSSSEQIVLPEEVRIFETNREEAKQKNIFLRFGMGMMFFFLILLSANYFYLGHLNDKIILNYEELSGFEDQLAQLSELEEERGRKEKLLQSSGLLNRNFLSYYLMELSHSVPSDITFDQIVARPLVEEIKKRHKIEFYEHKVLVKGQSKTSDILSRWIDKLKQEEWLSKVDILNYSYSKNVGHFDLEIIVY